MHFTAVGKWCRLYKKGAYDNLNIRKRGVKIGTNLKLTPEQSKIIKKIIIDKTPDQLKLSFCLWARRVIKALILMLW